MGYSFAIAGAVERMSEGNGEVGELEAVGAVNVPHMPQGSSHLLGHEDAISSMGEWSHRIEGFALQVLHLQPLILLKPGTGQDYRLPSSYRQLLTGTMGDKPGDNTAGIGDQSLGWRGEKDVDISLLNVIHGGFH